MDENVSRPYCPALILFCVLQLKFGFRRQPNVVCVQKSNPFRRRPLYTQIPRHTTVA
jgi:hypothetical protein